MFPQSPAPTGVMPPAIAPTALPLARSAPPSGGGSPIPPQALARLAALIAMSKEGKKGAPRAKVGPAPRPMR